MCCSQLDCYLGHCPTSWHFLNITFQRLDVSVNRLKWREKGRLLQCVPQTQLDQWWRLSGSKGPTTAGAPCSLPLPDDGNRPSLRNGRVSGKRPTWCPTHEVTVQLISSYSIPRQKLLGEKSNAPTTNKRHLIPFLRDSLFSPARKWAEKGFLVLAHISKHHDKYQHIYLKTGDRWLPKRRVSLH